MLTPNANHNKFLSAERKLRLKKTYSDNYRAAQDSYLDIQESKVLKLLDFLEYFTDFSIVFFHICSNCRRSRLAEPVRTPNMATEEVPEPNTRNPV